MKIAYCDCFSGISGDMFLAALLDAGLPLEHLQAQLALLKLPDPFEIGVSQTHKGAIVASLLEIKLEPHEHTHDHAEHEHTHEHAEHEHTHEHAEHAHTHTVQEQAEEQAAGTHSHAHHRPYSEIRQLIDDSGLSPAVKTGSQAIFHCLAEAEAQVHGVPVDEVHFHEVGAVDSIIDTVGAAIGLEYLGIERLYSSPLPLGSGQVNTQHGLLPVPAPATLRLLTAAHAKVVPSQAQVELVTPTGAAILAALATFQQPAMTLTGLGMGAGRRELPWPNVLRIMLGESETASLPLVVIETNIDDISAQALGHVMGRLFSAGALDVYFTPIYMKKNRPATMLSVIARKSDEAALARLILEETTTFGMRVQPIYRYEAERTFRSVQTEYGEVPLKLKILDGKVVQAAPEYEVCARLANEHNVPLARVYAAASRAAEDFAAD
jgi:pyridinium-3,5-bisthiocarboxylic acid mononucleotide nickel chelatase